MRQIIIALFGATALSIAWVPALAADMPAKAPVASSYSWTGFYFGANVGGGWGSRSASYNPNDFASAVVFGAALPAAGGAPPGSPSFRSSGALGGLQIGYNWQFNPNWIVGLETDFDLAGIRGSGSSASLPFGLSALATAEEQVKWFGTIRARLGYLPTDRLLIYGTGGFAYGLVEHTASYINTSGINFGAAGGPGLGSAMICPPGVPSCATGSSSSLATGWTLGTGFEYGFWKNVTLKAEYMHVDLGGGKSVTEHTSALCCGVTVLSSINANFSRTTLDVARVGVNFRY